MIESKKETSKPKVIISFDPGFVKLGYAILNIDSKELIKTETVSIRPPQKLS